MNVLYYLALGFVCGIWAGATAYWFGLRKLRARMRWLERRARTITAYGELYWLLRNGDGQDAMTPTALGRHLEAVQDMQP